jgi:hypothetical protein
MPLLPDRAVGPRRLAWAAALVIVHLAAGAASAAPAAALTLAPAADEPVELAADRLEVDEATGVLTANGHVVLERPGFRLEAEALRYERATGRGEVAGPLRLRGEGFEVDAERATFDLTARVADMYAFKGRWGSRAQFAGNRLRLSDDLIELEGAAGTTCLHPEPDLLLTARRFRYYPRAQTLNFTGSGVALKAFGREILTLPELNTTVDDKEKPGFDAWAFPAFAFDAYQGFLTSTKFDFTFGESSRGAIPVVVSTGRGLSAGIEHALGVGPGEVLNAVRYETPWATGQGGLRAQNGYQWRSRDGSRFEVSADYRANINEQAVHRLPEASWVLPSYRLGPFSYQSEVRAGYLWEESTNVQATRVRVAAPFGSPVWEPLPGWNTWITGSPWAHHYGFTHYWGGVLDWNNRQAVLPDLALTQTLETVRVDGETPFVHDRLIGADRVRLAVDKNWGPRVSTGLYGVWSRLHNAGPLLIEDVGLATTYRWNCFSLQVTLRPLVWGVDTRFQMLEL